jgi:signal transduction histidine kinase/HD-like signal output (HDOD) protein
MLMISPETSPVVGTPDVDSLPAQPEVVRAAVRALGRAGTPFERFRVLFCDPALTASVLKAAAQPHRLARDGPLSLSGIVAQLGPELLRSIVLSAAERLANAALQRTRPWQLTGFWLHALTSAHLGQALAESIRYATPDDAYLAGLLQDIGMLALASQQPSLYESFASPGAREVDMLTDEAGVLGVTHPAVSASLADDWSLPPRLGDALFLHHAPLQELRGTHPLVRIARVAEALADGTLSTDELQQACELLDLPMRALLQATNTGVSRAQAAAAELGISADLIKQHFPNGVPRFWAPYPQGPAPSAESSAETFMAPVTRDVITALIEQGSTQRLAGVLAPTRDLRSCLSLLRANLAVTDGWESCYFFALNAKTGILTGWHVVAQGIEDSGFQLPLSLTSSVIALAARERKPVSSVAGETVARRLMGVDVQVARRLKGVALLAVPLIAAEAVAGTLVVALPAEELRNAPVRLARLGEIAVTIAGKILQASATATEGKAKEQEIKREFQRLTRQRVHEARNPLTVIRNYLEILRQRIEAKESVDREIDVLKHEIDRIGALLNAISRAEVAPGDARQQADINRLINELMLAYQQPLFQERGIQVSLNLDARLPAIQVEPDLVKQVLLNLLKNASEALRAGDRVEIGTSDGVSHQGQPMIEITIADTGPGIPESVLEQLERSQLTNASGSDRGHGLANSLAFVKTLNGHMTWHSRQERGTAFSILLPRIVSPAAIADAERVEDKEN